MIREEITQQRLSSQRVGDTQMSVRNLIAHLGAIQAQDYYCGMWAIGARTGKTERDVIDATKKGEIVRTWSQRGTLHFVAAEDAKWMVDLSAPRKIAGAKTRHQGLGLDEKTLLRAKELFASALEGGRRLTRPQMMELLENAGISTEEQRGYHLLWFAAQTGLIYIGPMEGKQQTFGLLEDLPVKPKVLSGEAAITELTRRYFTGHGPASLADFAFWSGLSLTEAKRGLEAIKTELSCNLFEGKELWASPESCRHPPQTSLLPGFDEYILGYKDRSAQVTDENLRLLSPGRNGMFLYFIVSEGQVVGLWKRTLKKDRVQVSLQPFGRFSESELAGVEKAAQGYADFLELKLELS